jgi:hypothetical protein
LLCIQLLIEHDLFWKTCIHRRIKSRGKLFRIML